MSTTHQRFPTYKARKQSAKNDFHNQYRNEIKELISGTEYLDQIRSNGRIGTKENKKDENKIQNFNSLTPEAKRKLMFQKPISLVKRQNKYYSNHVKQSNQNIKSNENQKEFSDSNTISQEFNSEVPQFSPRTPTEKANLPKQMFTKTPPVNSDRLRFFLNQKQVQPSEIPKFNYDIQLDDQETDSNTFESEDKIDNNHFTIQKSDLDEDNLVKPNQSDCIKNKGFNYFQTTFDPEDQSDVDESEEFSSENKEDSVKEDSNSGSVHFKDNKDYFMHNTNTVKMISSDAIEAEVNFTSDSSSESEFQTQFFVQEKVVQPNNVSTIKSCEKFISSGAIESLSDE